MSVSVSEALGRMLAVLARFARTGGGKKKACQVLEFFPLDGAGLVKLQVIRQVLSNYRDPERSLKGTSLPLR